MEKWRQREREVILESAVAQKDPNTHLLDLKILSFFSWLYCTTHYVFVSITCVDVEPGIWIVLEKKLQKKWYRWSAFSKPPFFTLFIGFTSTILYVHMCEVVCVWHSAIKFSLNKGLRQIYPLKAYPTYVRGKSKYWALVCLDTRGYITKLMILCILQIDYNKMLLCSSLLVYNICYESDKKSVLSTIKAPYIYVKFE